MPMGTLEDSFRELARNMGAMIDGVTGPEYFRSSARDTWEPQLNVYEMADKWVVCVALPGIVPGELDVQVDEGILHIRGHRAKPRVPDADREISVHQMEIDSGRFHRSCPCPRTSTSTPAPPATRTATCGSCCRASTRRPMNRTNQVRRNDRCQRFEILCAARSRGRRTG
jgi:HSP20 family molecular chaperone IbpA